MIGQRIKEIREENHLNQKDFGKSLDLKPMQISRYERGEQSLSVKVIEQISLKYNVTTDWLITGRGFKYKDKGRIAEPEGKLLQKYQLLAKEDSELARLVIDFQTLIIEFLIYKKSMEQKK